MRFIEFLVVVAVAVGCSTTSPRREPLGEVSDGDCISSSVADLYAFTGAADASAPCGDLVKDGGCCYPSGHAAAGACHCQNQSVIPDGGARLWSCSAGTCSWDGGATCGDCK